MHKLALAVLLLAAVHLGHAAEARPAAADPALEARMLALAGQLRCLVCQNETLAASQAGLAIDLKNQIREKMRAGESDEAILAWLTARYGDFVLYNPPLKASTVLLWLGPFVLLIMAFTLLFAQIRRRAREAAAPLDETERQRARQLLEQARQ